MSELKPCPHGKEVRIINIGGLTPFSIVCWPVSDGHRCINLQLGWFATRDEAIAAWNTRASPTPTNDGEGLIEALKLAEQFLDKANALATGKYVGSVPVLADRLIEVREQCLAALNQGAGRE